MVLICALLYGLFKVPKLGVPMTIICCIILFVWWFANTPDKDGLTAMDKHRIMQNSAKKNAPATMGRVTALSAADRMDGVEFERWVGNLIQYYGFKDARFTPISGDQGVDIVAERDGKMYAIQCKRSASKVTNHAVQEVVAGKKLYGCHGGIVVTNNYYTDSAKQAAKANHIGLWDRDKLEEMVRAVKIQTAEEESEEKNPKRVRRSEDEEDDYLFIDLFCDDDDD